MNLETIKIAATKKLTIVINSNRNDDGGANNNAKNMANMPIISIIIMYLSIMNLIMMSVMKVMTLAIMKNGICLGNELKFNCCPWQNSNRNSATDNGNDHDYCDNGKINIEDMTWINMTMMGCDEVNEDINKKIQ